MRQTLMASVLIVMASSAGVPAAAQQVKALCTTSSRACLARTTMAYIDGLAHHDPSRTPFAPDVRCTEQGTVAVTDEKTFRSEIAGSVAITGVRNVRLLVDAETGSVGAFYLIDVAGAKTGSRAEFAYTVRRGQRFKIVKGLIKEVEILNFVEPQPKGLAPRLWPD